MAETADAAARAEVNDMGAAVCKSVAKASKVRILDLPPRASLQVSGMKALIAPKAVGAFCYVSAIQGFPGATSSLAGPIEACSVFGIDRTPNMRTYGAVVRGRGARHGIPSRGEPRRPHHGRATRP